MSQQYERFSDTKAEIISQITISEFAIQGLIHYDAQNRRAYDLEGMDGKMYREMEGMPIAMALLAEENYRFDDEHADYFDRGFAFTYSAIANQAELGGVDLTGADVDDNTYDMMALKILIANACNNPLSVAREAALRLDNGALANAWDDYLADCEGNASESLRAAFLIGGILCHDLIRDQLNLYRVQEFYAASVN